MFKSITFILPLLFFAAMFFSCSSRYVFNRHSELRADEQALDVAIPDEADDLLLKDQIAALRRERQNHLEEIKKLKKEIAKLDKNGRTSN